MPPKRACKATLATPIDPTTLIKSIEAIPVPEITLREQDPDKLPHFTNESSYPKLPPPPTQSEAQEPTQADNSETEDNKENCVILLNGYC